MCIEIDVDTNKVVERIVKAGKPLEGWSIKALSCSGTVTSLLQRSFIWRKGLNVAEGCCAATKFHLTLNKKNLAGFARVEHDNYKTVMCLIKVTVLTKDVSCVGKHKYVGSSHPITGKKAFTASRCQWDGTLAAVWNPKRGRWIKVNPKQTLDETAKHWYKKLEMAPAPLW